FKAGEVGVGHYANAVKLGDYYLSIHVDGVVTKTPLALQTGIIEPVAQDCLAMNTNDLACVGSKPLIAVDYLALERPNDELVSRVMKGLKEAAERAEVLILGGETAVMPGVITGFDLACTVVGVSEKLIVGSEVKPGDVIIGLRSSGPHSNGYSLIRRLINEGKLSLKDYAEDLMKPTKFYHKAVLSVIDKVKGAAHITGGAYTKVTRVTKHKVRLELPEPPEVFKAIERAGVPEDEMYRVFNMGIGMLLFVAKEDLDEVMRELKKWDEPLVVGRVEEGEGVYVTIYRGNTYRLA
ncbi:MAG: phosphoribosylformylglycinamidine cyclo-ligase, partial [Thermoprotei archaeon]